MERVVNLRSIMRVVKEHDEGGEFKEHYEGGEGAW